MPPEQAAGLLTTVIGENRAQAEPEAVAELAWIC
jgi:hypothetical protein